MSGQGNNTAFNVKNGMSVNTNLIWANNGQVGINTASPDANFAVIGTANVSGNTTITGKIVGSNTLAITGNTTLSNTILVTGNANFSNTLSVIGNLKVGNDSVSSSANISGNAYVVGNTVLINTLTVGNTTLILGPTTTNSAFTSANNAYFNGTARFNQNTYTNGLRSRIRILSGNPDAEEPESANLVYTVDITNVMRVNGAAIVSNNLTVQNTTTLSNTTNILGTTSIANSLYVNTGITVPAIQLPDGQFLPQFSDGVSRARFLTEFMVQNNASDYHITGPAAWDFNNTVKLRGPVYDYTGGAGPLGGVLISRGDHVEWGPVGSADITAPGANGMLVFNDSTALTGTDGLLFFKDGIVDMARVNTNAVGVLTIPNITAISGTLTLQSANTNFVANGYVGLGLNNPAYKLDITTNINNADGIRVTSTNGVGSAQSILRLRTLGANGLTIGQNYADKSAFITLADSSFLSIGTTSTQRMYISSNGNIAIGTSTNPAYTLDITGTSRASGGYIAASVSAGFRHINGNYGVFSWNDGSSYYLLSTSAGNQYGSYNSYRPFAFNLGNGSVTIDGSGSGTTIGGVLTINGYTTHNAGCTINNGDLNVNADIRAIRPSSPSTGVIYLGNTGNRYLYFDGANYQMPTSNLYVNGGRALTSTNYNDVVPSIYGANAQGNWNINITGSAATLSGFIINQNLATYSNPTFSSLYAQIIYDSNDTNYYLDPNGTSRLNSVNLNQLYSYGAVYGTTFIDSNDNNYYVDPNGVSYVNDFRPNFIYDRKDPNWYVNPSQTSRLNQLLLGGNLVMNNSAPTLYFQDTDGYSAMLHNNSNLLYVLRGGVNTTSWNTVGPSYWWPTVWDLTNNNCTFGGNLTVAYDVTAFASDGRLKENIKEIPNAIEKIKKIRGVTFDWNEKADSLGFTPERKLDEVGVIAQEIEEVLPQVIALAPFDKWLPEPDKKYTDEELKKTGTSRSGENYKTVKYEKIVPLLIQAIKEQQTQIEELKQEIEEIKKCH